MNRSSLHVSAMRLALAAVTIAVVIEGQPAIADCCGGLGESVPADGQIAFSSTDGPIRFEVRCEYVFTNASTTAHERTVGLAATAETVQRTTGVPVTTSVTCFLDTGTGPAASSVMAGPRADAYGLQTHDVRSAVLACAWAEADVLDGTHRSETVCHEL